MRGVWAPMTRVRVGANDTTLSGRLKPSPQSERREPSEAIVELSLVVLNEPNVISGRYLKSPIARSADGANPSDAGSNVCEGSRYSPNRDQLPRTSSNVAEDSVEV